MVELADALATFPRPGLHQDQPTGEESVTRDEHRAQCIEAMRAAYRTELNADGRAEEMRGGLRAMTAAFDSLHGAARVDPIEATEGMIGAGRAANLEQYPNSGLYERLWRAMAASGDLTNQPEAKP